MAAMRRHAAVQHIATLGNNKENLLFAIPEVHMFNLIADSWSFFGLPPWPGTGESGQRPDASCAAQGEFIAGEFDSGAYSLRYKLYIPSAYCGAPLPLVVMLHGCGQDAADFALGTGMNALAERMHCLVLYPEQSSQANWNRCWNWYDQAHHERDEGEPAVIAGLTQTISAQYAVDRARVAVAGLSSGGAMAVILGRTYPDVFKAVGCHSGLAHGSATNSLNAMSAMRGGADPATLHGATPPASIPIIVFHGDEDGTVHQKNGSDVVRQTLACHLAQAPAESTELVTVEETGETGGRSFTRHTHREHGGEVIAEHWTIHGTGHAWSGGRREGSYTDTSGPDASKEMLRFFMRE
jgi:poly(hydroxyalkanoate) depolymerase family esterase